MHPHQNYNVSKEFLSGISDEKSFLKRNKIKGLRKIKFLQKFKRSMNMANSKLEETLAKKECYIGPFKGEFGHILGHTTPFLMYLHKQGVKIHFCGMKIHEPYFKDEEGNSILTEFHELRDFFAEVSPSSNSTKVPVDVQKEIDLFSGKAQKSGLPFWNLDDDYYYWFIHRKFVEKHNHIYDLSKFYATTKNENNCVIFPRAKGAKSSKNNGESWDYQELLERISPYFDRVFICGHPSQSLALKPTQNTELVVTADNQKILEACSNANLIITQHSGANYIGLYTNCEVLTIYKGGSKIEDIGSMQNTIRFRTSLKENHPLKFAFSEDEIITFIENRK